METEQSAQLMEPTELIAFEVVYRTILDCYKIAIGEWRHFRTVKAMDEAKARLVEWLDSDPFVDYCWYFGFHPWQARRGAMDLLLGNYTPEQMEQVKEMLDDIGRQRDNRRKREEGASNGTRGQRRVHIERITRICGGIRGIGSGEACRAGNG